MKASDLIFKGKIQYISIIAIAAIGYILSTLLLFYVSVSAFIAGCGLVTIFSSEHICNYINRQKPHLLSSKKPLATQAISFGVPISITLLILCVYYAF